MATYEEKSITAQNLFTDSVSIGRGGATVVIIDTSSMSMTVVLQIYINGDWRDTGDTWTAEGTHDIFGVSDFLMRVGVKTGGYTSGTATVQLYRKQ